MYAKFLLTKLSRNSCYEGMKDMKADSKLDTYQIRKQSCSSLSLFQRVMYCLIDFFKEQCVTDLKLLFGKAPSLHLFPICPFTLPRKIISMKFEDYKNRQMLYVYLIV